MENGGVCVCVIACVFFLFSSSLAHQDEVLKYLIESKKQVVMASKSLKTIMDCLGISE